MHVLILVEPIAEGRFRAKAGEPFGVTADPRMKILASQRRVDGSTPYLRCGLAN
jgi:hypothetical protein